MLEGIYKLWVSSDGKQNFWWPTGLQYVVPSSQIAPSSLTAMLYPLLLWCCIRFSGEENGSDEFIVVAAIFIFDIILFQSILGMHIFGCKFSLRTDTGDTVPDRKNFDSLLWAIVTVFQVSSLCSLWVVQGKVKRIRRCFFLSEEHCTDSWQQERLWRKNNCILESNNWCVSQTEDLFLPRRWCIKVTPVVAIPKFNTLTSAHNCPNGCSCFFLLS